MRRRLLLLALAALVAVAAAHAGEHGEAKAAGGETAQRVESQKNEVQTAGTQATPVKDEYSLGDLVDIECAVKNATGMTWGSAPICKETGQELFVLFGIDYFMYCGFILQTQEEYDALAAKIKLEETWQCRVPMVPSKKFWVPFTIQMWGVVEEEHLHVDAHVNLVFHADAGMILGAAAYPVLDRFQYGKQGSLINLHGPVRWFLKHSFSAYAPTGPQEGAFNDMGLVTGILVALASVVLTSLIACATFAMIYRYVLKPRLVKKFLKKD